MLPTFWITNQSHKSYQLQTHVQAKISKCHTSYTNIFTKFYQLASDSLLSLRKCEKVIKGHKSYDENVTQFNLQIPQ